MTAARAPNGLACHDDFIKKKFTFAAIEGVVLAAI